MVSSPAPLRAPYSPVRSDWPNCYQMLCGHCDLQGGCAVIEGMIEMASGGAWPEGGWVTDPGAGVTCLSYVPRARPSLPRQQLRAIQRTKESALPSVCGGCAARKGSEASTSLHTRRDYQACVRSRSPFVCHEDPKHERLCGGWCRAIQRRST
ncbi:hypothetical protein OSH11_13690 [Kaistia dalseonensis]|uniref:Uncharacterized protein n=1 Tax=Kaistia dalseonensis TaxID=410840 RepID=A0ABU0H7U1_9HYPH|nr:hypothetical protein [Kaistia dalseonensis]MCX5495761.1 hypothetical protein [Kaistia dalseonensis]MDQ0438361.1 hypothetical protein [Kaistia dalseonensis]